MNPAQAVADFKKYLAARNLRAMRAALGEFFTTKYSVADLAAVNEVIAAEREFFSRSLEGPPVRCAILGGFTTQPIKLLITPLLLAEGIFAEVYEANYDTWRLEVLNPASGLYASKPDLILFAVGLSNLSQLPAIGAAKIEVEALVEATVCDLRELWSAAARGTGAAIVQHNFVPPAEQPAGRSEARVPWSVTCFVNALNESLWAEDGKGMRILDVAAAAIRVGLDTWCDPRWIHHSKHGFNPAVISSYGQLLGGHLRAHFGRAKKCLVLDLDDTLWGGTVGDDGVDGILLGPGTAEGEAFAAFCAYVKALRGKGVLLAVNSRNDPAVARSVFERHPAMVLRPDDFSVFECNWQPKPANLRTIASRLNLGMESLVFMDNDAALCAEVREAEPSVCVVEAAGDPAYFPRLLDRRRLFETLDITPEDLNRANAYTAREKAVALAAGHTSHEEFLGALAMSTGQQMPGASELPRLEQLFKKTNQFNLTGGTFSTEELARRLTDPDSVCLSVKLTDRLASHGIVAALVGHFDNRTLVVENWVMSCRVFARTLEDHVLNLLATIAESRGAVRIGGEFRMTGKNGYARLWLEQSHLLESPDHWWLNLPSTPRPTFVRSTSTAEIP